MLIRCDYCRKEFNRVPSLWKTKPKNFCSRKCWNNWRAIFIICKVCGKVRKTCFSRLKAGKGKYCSSKCFHKDLGKNLMNGREIKCKECGKMVYRNKKQLEFSKYCSPKCKSIGRGKENKGKKRPNFSGEKHWNWKGGISDERTKLWNSGEYNKWRQEIYKKNNFTCQKCEDNSGNNLIPHHIDSFADYPLLRFEIINGITLCKNCHSYFHSKYGTHHNNRNQLDQFLNEKQKIIITTRGKKIMVLENSR